MTAKTLIKILCLSSAVVLSPCTQAKEKEHKIDLWLAKKMETAISTAEMCGALGEAAQMWDKQMNASYQYLMDKLDAEDKASLVKSQRAWLAFRDAEAEAHGIVANPRFGTVGRIEAADLYYQMIKSRAKKLALYESKIRGLHGEQPGGESG